MNISFRSWVVCFLLFSFSAVLVHCTSKKNNDYQSPKSEPSQNSKNFQGLLSEEKTFLKDSEVHLSFEEETTKKAKRIAVSAANDKFSVFSDTLSKEGKRSSITEQDYLGLIAKLKQINESDLVTNPEALFSEHEGPCREVFKIYIRIGAEERSYFGCRGEDTTATQVSKIARELEYLLLKSAQP